MSRLFASHLLQTTSPVNIPGHYDQEQELWVGDNLLQGSALAKYPTNTQPPTAHLWHGVTYVWNGCEYIVEDDEIWEPDPSDTDVDP